MALNESREHGVCCDTMPSAGNQSKSTGLSSSFVHKDDLVRITKAFREEKKETERLRRQMPEVAMKLETVRELTELIRTEMPTKSESGNIINEVESVKIEVKNFSQAFQITSTEAFDAIDKVEDNFKLILEGMTAKIDRLGESLRTLSGKVGEIENILNGSDSSDTFQTRLENMEKTLNKILSRVTPKNESCLSHYNAGSTSNGVYDVYPTSSDKPLRVYCDMTTDGGGWTVFQRRKDGSVDFFRGWQEYKQGFGDVTGEFWLGNDHIADLTRSGDHGLRIELEDFDGNRKYAKYGKFRISPEADSYRLLIDLYSGDAGDSMGFHNGMEFSTKDRDNDKSSYNCADRYKGAWWYNKCHYSNLNGLYLKGPGTTSSEGVNWYHWRGHEYSLKMTEMKLK